MRATLKAVFLLTLSTSWAHAQQAVYHAEGNFTDSSANGHHATPKGTVGFRPGGGI